MNKIWWENEITFEDIIYDGLGSYESIDAIPNEVISFVVGILNKGAQTITEDTLIEFLRESNIWEWHYE